MAPFQNSGIYMIKNTLNGKCYVGQTSRLQQRFYEHKNNLRHSQSFNAHLQRAWNKYGEEAFEFSILEYCPIEQLDEREKYWIAETKAYEEGYNMSIGGGGVRGYKASEEARNKISKALKGRKKTAEQIEAMSARQKQYRAQHKEDFCKQVICLNTGQLFTSIKEAVEKYGIFGSSSISRVCNRKRKYAGTDQDGNRLVWVWPDDYENMSKEEKDCLLDMAYAPHKMNPKACEKRNAALKGKKRSPEQKERISAATKKWVEESGHPRSIKVVCLNDGSVYKDSKEAAAKTGASSGSIRRCCNGELWSTRGDTNNHLIWVDYADYLEMTPEDIQIRMTPKPNKNNIPVCCMDDGTVYESIKVASQAAGVSPQGIAACCKGKQSAAGGMEWEYYKETTPSDAKIAV